MASARASLFTVQEILGATGGRLVDGAGSGSTQPVYSVSIDSRTAESESLFVPLPGEKTDGHFFVGAALKSGSSLSLVNRTFLEKNQQQFVEVIREHGTRLVVVPDTLDALQNLARFHMRRLQGVVIIGVTGSTGKTTTKEIIGSMLLREAPGFMNRGNLNSEIGLPLSTFDVKPGHRYAVFEMGISRQGEMDVLADIVRPDVGVITNIGTAHVGFFGTQDGIAAEKKRIFSKFDGRQTGFVWEDEPYFAFLSEGVAGRIETFGRRSTPGFEHAESRGIDGWLLRLDDRSIRLPLYGEHNVRNVLCGVSVAKFLGVSAAHIHAAIESLSPLPGRGRILRGSVTVVEDTYNANPEAYERAVEFFDEVPWDGRKVMVVGPMKELGALSAQAHRALIERIGTAHIDAAFFYGDELAAAAESAANKQRVRSSWTDDFEELKKRVVQFVRPGDLVLMKGSRAAALERLVPWLTGSADGLATSAHGGSRC